MTDEYPATIASRATEDPEKIESADDAVLATRRTRIVVKRNLEADRKKLAALMEEIAREEAFLERTAEVEPKEETT